MKTIIQVALAIVLTVFCVFTAMIAIKNFSQPQEMLIGPNKLVQLDGGSTFSSPSDSLFTFKSSEYFEIKQEGSLQPVLSTKEPPAVGETESLYWIRNFQISGDYVMTKQYAKVYNQTIDTTILVTPGFGAIITFSIMVFALFVVIWLLGMSIIVRL